MEDCNHSHSGSAELQGNGTTMRAIGTREITVCCSMNDCSRLPGAIINAQFTPPARHDKTVLSVSSYHHHHHHHHVFVYCRSCHTQLSHTYYDNCTLLWQHTDINLTVAFIENRLSVSYLSATKTNVSRHLSCRVRRRELSLETV